MPPEKSTIKIGKDVMYLPIGQMLTSIAKGIAEAQFNLDKVSMETAEFMGGERVMRDEQTGAAIIDDTTNQYKTIDTRMYFGHLYEGANNDVIPQKLSMIELGFVPNFYHFVDTVITMKVAMKVVRVDGNEHDVHTASVDAHYASAYNYNLDFATTVQTKIVPIPPPALMEERLRMMSEMNQRTDDLKLINGIGPKTEYVLNEAGIQTWRKLSETSEEDLAAILKAGKVRASADEQRKWITQAGNAFRGNWETFTKGKEKEAPKDDLTKINGLGEVSAQALARSDLKIISFKDLAKTSRAKLIAILSEKKIHADPTTWPQEAAYHAQGDAKGIEEYLRNLSRKDDLTQIKGLGAESEKKLNDKGIESYLDLSKADVKTITELLSNEDGKLHHRIRKQVDNWPELALKKYLDKVKNTAKFK